VLPTSRSSRLVVFRNASTGTEPASEFGGAGRRDCSETTTFRRWAPSSPSAAAAAGRCWTWSPASTAAARRWTTPASSPASSWHDLRRAALTHLGEDNVSLPLLMAKSRHKDLRSLQRYVGPSPEAVAALT
jgi:hypothetical protein